MSGTFQRNCVVRSCNSDSLTIAARRKGLSLTDMSPISWAHRRSAGLQLWLFGTGVPIWRQARFIDRSLENSDVFQHAGSPPAVRQTGGLIAVIAERDRTIVQCNMK